MNDDDQLTSRPLAPLEMDREGALWFFTDLRYAKVEHLCQLNLSFSNMHNSTYVSVCGRGEICTDQARINALWTAFARPWVRDGRTSNDLALLKIRPAIASYWDAPYSKMVCMLPESPSAVSAMPFAAGQRNILSDRAPWMQATTTQ